MTIDLVLVWVPPPQVAEQVLHGPQSLTAQSTGVGPKEIVRCQRARFFAAPCANSFVAIITDHSQAKECATFSFSIYNLGGSIIQQRAAKEERSAAFAA